ncbi:MAG: aldehyde dehydrogenase family protein [Rhizobiaceae bacterium]
MIDKRQFYIGGEWVAPVATKTRNVIHPGNEQAVAVISLAGKDDVDRAVASARDSFENWSTTSVLERVVLLERLLEIYKRRYGEMAEAITLELGAPAKMSREQQARSGVRHLESFLVSVKEMVWREQLSSGDILVKEPIGVCGLITPWNWPVSQIALKVIPALATGCTCVLKPSEFTPLSAMLYAEMIDEAGFPAGVFNLVNGEGEDAGALLSSHPLVDMISFTGSTRAGVAVTTTSAPTVKRVALELGGKSPNIVFADADLPEKVRDGVLECFNNSGQSCDAPTRMLVEQSVYDEVVQIAVQVANQVSVGDPKQEGDHIGPLVSQIQWNRVQSLVSAGVAEGAKAVVGGPGRPPELNQGYYVRPTIFADVNNKMRIAKEEIFGPVLCLIPFDTEEEAIEIANDTPYGLAAYVQTNDMEKAQRVAARLRVGAVHINGGPHRYGSPFGGYKQSGNGREGGRMGLEEFLETKTIHFP